MTSTFKAGLLAALAAFSVLPAEAFAQEAADIFAKDRWQFRLRAVGVLPEGGGHTTIGGTPEPDNAVVPEFDISYFFTDHIAAELILATSPHDVTLKNRPAGAGDLELGDTMILPPTLTLQYHFMPEKTFSPYIGAGINYTLPYSEDPAGGVVTALDTDGSLGTALQAGTDIWLNEHWGLNLDIKKIWVDVDASINNGAITGEVQLDPWVVGAGVSYRF